MSWKSLRCVMVIATLMSGLAQTATSQGPSDLGFEPPLVDERYPDEMQARLESRDQQLLEAAPPTMFGQPLQFILEDARRWLPGSIVTVAFRGGTKSLHAMVASAAKEWTSQGANLTLDFGLNTQTGEYRSWSTTDTALAADIRVGFDLGGYWSLVGNDSVDATIVSPEQTSLNLGMFHIKLPGDWSAVVLHEFGHALGFHHEHQSPAGTCDSQFRWENDPGYVLQTNAKGEAIARDGRRPGIYTVLGHAQNYWPRAKVDFNLRQLPDSNAYLVAGFNSASIMMYSFPAWMFVKGTDSSCYSTRNVALSRGDFEGVLQAYPPTGADMAAVRSARLRNAEALSTMSGIDQQLRNSIRAYMDRAPDGPNP